MAKVKSIMGYNMDNCLVCGSPYVQVHHVIYGTANRKLSDKYGLVVPLCQEHHTGQTGVHHNKKFDLFLKKEAQKKYEQNYGNGEDFKRIFGKSYL